MNMHNILHLIRGIHETSPSYNVIRHKEHTNKQLRDFPGGAVVKNPSANAGDMGSMPGPGRSHMPWSN